MFDWEVNSDPPGSQDDHRPYPGSRTTPLSVRQAVVDWLHGGRSPGAAIASAKTELLSDAAVASLGHLVRSQPVVQLADIEDVAMQCNRQTNAARCTAAYSNPADDPRCAGRSSCHSTGLTITVSNVPGKPRSGQQEEVRKSHDGARSKPPALECLGTGAVVTRGGDASQSSAQASSGTQVHPITDPEWEQVCAVLSLEVLCHSGDCRSPGSTKIAAVGYALQPHSGEKDGNFCQLPREYGAFAVRKDEQPLVGEDVEELKRTGGFQLTMASS
eukprot:6473437-Amphidinium_carterae.1